MKKIMMDMNREKRKEFAQELSKIVTLNNKPYFDVKWIEKNILKINSDKGANKNKK